MPYDSIVQTREGDIAIVTLNRPDRRNALSLGLMLELIDCLDNIGRDVSIRAVILNANGPAFSAGHDLREMANGSVNEYRRLFDVCTELMAKVQSIPQPVIAEVHAIATAAGCQIVATCDLAIASEAATFATPGVKIGLFCTTPMVALTRAIGRKRAMEMLLTGKPIAAHTAAEWGLVNRVVAGADLPAATRELAAQIASASSFTVGLGKQAFYTQIDLDQPKAYAYAKEVMSMNSLASDAQEGIGAFLEKTCSVLDGPMITDLVQIQRLGEKKLEENKRLRVHMKTHPIPERRLRRIGEEIENAIDCTQCANCCRVATATVRDREIDTLARFIGVTRQVFLRDYTERSEEEGVILKRTDKGCIFLDGNLCSVYDARPKTCNDFPHLVRGEGSLLARMWHMPDRATYCPIAYNTLEEFKTAVGFVQRK